MKYSPVLLSLALVALGVAPRPSAERGRGTDAGPQDDALRAAILAAEDARADTPDGLNPIFTGLTAGDPTIRLLAVRALGRMERPSLVPRIVPLLSDDLPAVRREAGNALGQAVFNDNAAAVSGILLDDLTTEVDATVRGVVVQTLGRLPYESMERVQAVEEVLIRSLTQSADMPPAVLGAARGLESLLRRNAATHVPAPAAVAALTQAAAWGRSELAPFEDEMVATRIRRLATAALVAVRRLGPARIRESRNDPDVEVRRLSLSAARVQDSLDDRSQIIIVALRDPSPRVRYEALRAYGRWLQPTFGCEPLRKAVADDDPHVSLAAIDLLGNDCTQGESPVGLLQGLLAELPSEPTRQWHRPAHALTSLAKLAPRATASVVDDFARHPVWQVRMYAAHAAEQLTDIDQLKRLAFDRHHNVREAAIAGLQRLAVPDAVSASIAALQDTDYQLVRTAANGVDAAADASNAVPALLSALRRITGERRETSRDTRMALLGALIRFGAAVPETELTPYLRDFDPAVASRVAQALTGRTGRPQHADPSPLPRHPVPTQEEIATLNASRAVIHMQSGGEIELRLLASDAPTNVARFARLARSGYFDGLTFHRVEPNFVIQGGSPHANEYSGDGPFTRDELTARPHLRGTVGLSTRGRDTGDGQIFINLVDNVRLDHNYTILAEVTVGMDVVDGILEGAVIESITLHQR
jgi:cyclophilin family peptidyl-prolyl cis-trans isomerase/HEAT repeat protein